MLLRQGHEPTVRPPRSDHDPAVAGTLTSRGNGMKDPADNDRCVLSGTGLRVWGSRAGFTLVEILVVVALIAVMVGLAAPQLGLGRIRADGAMTDVGVTLIGAQRKAVQLQHNVVVAIDTTNMRLRVHADADNDGAIDDGEKIRYHEITEGIVFGLGGAPARPMGGDPINLTKQQDGFPAVTFHRNGSASEMGGLYLTTPAAAQSETDYEARAIEIERGTGRVTWYKYVGAEWKRGF